MGTEVRKEVNQKKTFVVVPLIEDEFALRLGAVHWKCPFCEGESGAIAAIFERIPYIGSFCAITKQVYLVCGMSPEQIEEDEKIEQENNLGKPN